VIRRLRRFRAKVCDRIELIRLSNHLRREGRRVLAKPTMVAEAVGPAWIPPPDPEIAERAAAEYEEAVDELRRAREGLPPANTNPDAWWIRGG